MMKRVFVRADDFGISRSVNDGIMQCIDESIVKNVSVLVNLPSVTYRFVELSDRDVSIGLHCNISVGRPCHQESMSSSLVRDGVFLSSKELRMMKEEYFDEEAIRCELIAQFERFVQIAGRKPDYMDVHSVVSRKFMEVSRQIAEDKGILYVNTPLSPDEYEISGKAMAWMISDGDLDRRYGIFEKLFDQDREINVAVFHPGRIDDELRRCSSLTQERINDLKILTDAETIRYIRGQKIIADRFDRLNDRDLIRSFK